MIRAIFFAAAICALPALATDASATTTTVASDARGWVLSDGRLNGTNPRNNYAVGSSCLGGDCNQNVEVRNFFSFTLPAFTGTITSARLLISAGIIIDNQTPGVAWQFTSLAALPAAAAAFADLGTGTVYGGGTVFSSSNGTLLTFDLNNAGVAALASGSSFLIGGRVTNAVFAVGQSDQLLFAVSPDLPVSLEFTTAAVPEPASWALLIAGFGLTGAAARRQRHVQHA